MYDKNNRFARILRGEEETQIIYEDDKVVAFLNARPKAKIHFFVIPKGEYSSFQDFADKAGAKAVGHFFKVAKYVAVKICRLEESGYRMIINDGPDSHSHVPHTHVQILGGNHLGTVLDRDHMHILSDANKNIPVISRKCAEHVTEIPAELDEHGIEEEMLALDRQISTLEHTKYQLNLELGGEKESKECWLRERDKLVEERRILKDLLTSSKKESLLFGVPQYIKQTWNNQGIVYKFFASAMTVGYFLLFPIIAILSIFGATTRVESEMNYEQVKEFVNAGLEEERKKSCSLESAEIEPVQQENIAKEQNFRVQ
jgi:diadenosine tetraphosphate (Ap4A) HIT family hydrolase